MNLELLYDFNTQLGIPGFQHEYQDLLAIVLDSPRETSLLATASNILPQNVIPVQSFSFSLEQSATSRERLAGEGADPNTLFVARTLVHSNFKMPLYAPIIGYVHPVFASLWYQTQLAYWGTASSAIAGLVNEAPAGSTALVVDNVADFAGIPVPFSATFLDNNEVVNVIVVNKATRTLSLATNTAHDHLQGMALSCTPNQSGMAEPAFTLLSLREGMLSPTLVNKLTIDASANSPVEITVDVASLGVARGQQIALAAARDAIVSGYAAQIPTRLVQGLAVTLSPASANSGAFGLSSALGDTLFGGFQGLGLPDFVVTGISLTVDNHLAEVYSLKSQLAGGARQRENSFPMALASNGRTITGKIRYRAPIDPWLVAERLAGPSALNGGGLVVDYGNCQITMSELAWAPSASTGVAEDSGAQERTLDFTMVAESFDAMPELEYSVQE